MNFKKSILVILLIVVTIFFFSTCINNAGAGSDSRGIYYASAASCYSCHKAIYDSFVTTAHMNSTAVANAANIHGSFANAQNSFTYSDGTVLKMEKRDSGFFQVAYKDGKETEAYRIDIVFGRMNAQTFLYWKGNNTFELPVSHYAAYDTWATSPGYKPSEPNFNRLIGTTCFECHSSAMETQAFMNSSGSSEETIRGSIIYGIDCQRCHGPSAAHVEYHTENPDVKVANYIVKTTMLTRQQKMDGCALCHSGNQRERIMSRFRFMPGDTLENMYMPFVTNRNTTEFDVHGNQSQLLAQSACYKASTLMTCNTCHSPHTDASDNLAIYSQKCISCHKDVNAEHIAAPEALKLGEVIRNNCIDCHMPNQSSKAITFYLSDSVKKSAYMLRTHRIAIYNADTLIKRIASHKTAKK